MVRIYHLLLLGKCLPHLGPSTSQIQTFVLAGMVFSPSSDELEKSSSPGQSHFLCLLLEISSPMDVTTDRKRFLTKT